MDMTALFFAQNNDIIVTAKFPDIIDGTGITAEFWYKADKTTPDDDPSTSTYTSNMIQGDDEIWYSQFSIPADDNAASGAFWWRVDAIDSFSQRRTAGCGTLLVEAV
jgi:hypothetical protein